MFLLPSMALKCQIPRVYSPSVAAVERHAHPNPKEPKSRARFVTLAVPLGAEWALSIAMMP